MVFVHSMDLGPNKSSYNLKELSNDIGNFCLQHIVN